MKNITWRNPADWNHEPREAAIAGFPLAGRQTAAGISGPPRSELWTVVFIQPAHKGVLRPRFRWLLIGLATLILCSCRAVDSPPGQVTGAGEGITPGSVSGAISPTAPRAAQAEIVPAAGRPSSVPSAGSVPLESFASPHPSAQANRFRAAATAGQAAGAYLVATSDSSPSVAPVRDALQQAAMEATAEASDAISLPVAAGAVPSHGEPPCPAPLHAAQASWRPEGIAPPWPADEYLCDGGDSQVRASLGQDGQLRGLDLEDTIAQFETRDGQIVITPSNSVCVYAPRFAAVRWVTAASEADLSQQMEAVDSPLPAISQEQRLLANTAEQPLPALHEYTLHIPEILRERLRDTELTGARRVRELVRDFAAHEDFQLIRFGVMKQSEKALLEYHVDAALEWIDHAAAEVLIDEEPSAIEQSVQATGTIAWVDEPDRPRLRLIKLASTAAAQPGEEVEFTLRFDNVGDQPIQRLTLVDNLTTRLAYVEGSAQSDLPVEFSVAENEGASLTLRWQFQQPLAPGEGGIVRFTCRVR